MIITILIILIIIPSTPFSLSPECFVYILATFRSCPETEKSPQLSLSFPAFASSLITLSGRQQPSTATSPELNTQILLPESLQEADLTSWPTTVSTLNKLHRPLCHLSRGQDSLGAMRQREVSGSRRSSLPASQSRSRSRTSSCTAGRRRGTR